MIDKYPNADTSPERLAHIERRYNFLPDEWQYCERDGYIVRDLLAMLQERDAVIYKLQEQLQNERDVVSELSKDCIRLGQQLHDQRWRRLSEEKLPLDKPYEIGWRNTRGDEYFRINGPENITDWWRPIPPLPTEKE